MQAIESSNSANGPISSSTSEVVSNSSPLDTAPDHQISWSLSQTRNLILAVVSLFMVTALVTGYIWFSRKNRNAPSANSASIAVLPFADLSQNKDQEYFSDGLSEE